MTITRRQILGCATAAPLAFATQAFGAGYPDRPIKMIVAFAPGTGSDIIARVLAQKLQERLGQSVVIENRAGAGGSIGTVALQKAPADGYTLALSTNATLITAPLLLAVPPYRADRDFTPIGTIARTPMVVVTSSAAGAPQSFQEMVARGRAGDVSFASAGVGTIGHLTSEVIVKRLDLKARHVPYKGSPPSLTDVARGEILFATDTPAAALPLINGNRLRPLAITGDKRLRSLPDVPTLQELGVPDVNLSVWWGVLGPAGLPHAVVERIGAELVKIAADPDMATKMKELELESLTYDAPRFDAFIRTEYPFWQKFLSQANIKLE